MHPKNIIALVKEKHQSGQFLKEIADCLNLKKATVQYMTKNNYTRQKKKCETKRKIGKAESINIKRTFSSFETNEEKVSLKKLIAHTKLKCPRAQ